LQIAARHEGELRWKARSGRRRDADVRRDGPG
jgi:hypothetical protein